MKETPILFSTPMVQSILEGRKTQTRRLVKHPKNVPSDHILRTDVMRDKSIVWFQNPDYNNVGYSHDSPYGKPGDLLWVRETWAPDLAGNGENGYTEFIKYAADGTSLPINWVKDYDRFSNKPGIHMNKEYARIWLQVESVRVERLQDISEQDAIAEGVERLKGAQWKDPSTGLFRDYTYKDAFELLWESINGTDSWQANPWVWVVSFRVLSTTGKPDLQTTNK